MEDRSLDSLFVALADQRRRSVCRYIARTGEPVVTLDELAASVSPKEQPVPASPAAEAGADENVRVSLHHVHLPKLDDAAIVEYARERKAVRTGTSFPLALDLLQTVEAPERDLDRGVGR